jgi:hypothetical protein
MIATEQFQGFFLEFKGREIVSDKNGDVCGTFSERRRMERRQNARSKLSRKRALRKVTIGAYYPTIFSALDCASKRRGKNFAVFIVGADLRVCPGVTSYTAVGADTQVCPYDG